MRRTTAAALAAFSVLALSGCEAADPRRDSPTPGATSATPDPLAGLPPAVHAFLSADREHPLGEPGKGAPPENDFFAALVGVWSCRLRFDQGNGQIRYGYPATWAFKYSAGGHAIEHLYYQRKANLVPPLAALDRDFHTVALVLYDPTVKAWRFVGASNIAGSTVDPSTTVMTGHLERGALAFRPDVQRPGPYVKEVFHSIEPDAFIWTQFESRDRGRTWVESVSIVCDRQL